MNKNVLKVKNYLTKLRTMSFGLLLLGGSIFFIGCEKENLQESVKDDFDEKTYRPEDKTVYFEGIGDIEVKFDRTSEKINKLIKDENFMKMKNFVAEAKEINFYLDEENKMHIFKTSKASMDFIQNKFELQERCSPNFSGNITTTFYKHRNLVTPFTGLTMTGPFEIPVVNTYHTSSNDEISSLSISNNRMETGFMLNMFRHTYYGGDYGIMTIQKCSNYIAIDDMSLTWYWWNAFNSTWNSNYSFNDAISSIKGFNYY